MNHRRKWSLIWILIPIIVVGIFVLVSIHYLLDPHLYRNILQKSLTTLMDREVTIGKARIYLWGGVGIAIEDLQVRDRSLAFDILQSKRLILQVDLFPLLKREIKWKRIVVDHPTFRLVRGENGQFNIFSEGPLSGETFKEIQKKSLKVLASLFEGSLTLREGKILFSDETFSPSPLKTEIRSFNVELTKISYDKAFPFRIRGKILHSRKEGQFFVHGTIQNILEDMDFSNGRVDAGVKIKDIDTFHFWPYLKALLPMKTISGILTLNAKFQGNFRGAFKISAKIKMNELFLDYPQVFSTSLKPEWVNIDVETAYDLKNLNIPRFSIELPELWIKAKARIYDIGSKEMGMEAEANSSPFDITEGKKFIPFRIITPDVSEHLYRSEGKGLFQILSVKLEGKMPEIDHCDQPANVHVLSVEAKLDGARLNLPWNFPPLEDLKGQLLFQKGTLYLKEVEGRILHTTLEKINGTFYELLHIPTLQLDCQGKFDLIDLPKLSKTDGLSEEINRSLSSIHIVSGRANYSLSAKGVLKPPLQFQHQGTYMLSNIRFTHQQFPFPISIENGKVQLSHNDLQWSDTKVEFGHSSLLTNGLLKHGEKSHPLEIMIRGRVDLKNFFVLFQTPFFPEEVRLKMNDFEALSGTGFISFKGKTISENSHFSYEGEFSPREASFKHKGNPIPLVCKEGSISFSNLGIHFSKTKFQSGSSSLTLDGFIKEGNLDLFTWGAMDLKQLYSLLKLPHFPDPIRSKVEGIQDLSGGAEVRLKWMGQMKNWTNTLREGEIRLKGMSLRHRAIPVPLSQIEGFFHVTPGQIRFDEVKGKVGDSPLTISGTLSWPSLSSPSVSPYPSGKVIGLAESSRRFSFRISSSYLDLDPIFPKEEGTAPNSFKKVRDWLSNWSIDGKVKIDKGAYRSLRYQDLKGEMKMTDGTLFIHPFHFKSDGGNFWGEGWIKPTDKGIKFEIKPRVSNIESHTFFRTLFQKGEDKMEMTGRVHIDKVELQGEGEDFQKMKESLNGRLRFEIEDGVIRRFNILSKIFSILNVSQLLKGRFPDLKTKGLPYHQILANFYVKDGVASTDDFLVESDAMRITLLGKVDLSKNLMDAKIGVHPLVTIDMILSNVPIAGYILTGKDKAFISYFYEVKGSLDDPKIEAIPIKSIEESTWGIIKRLLETPLRPFQ